jgi:hypothetical protein
MTETASVLTVQTPDNYAPNSVGRMIGGIDAKVIDENGKGMYLMFGLGLNKSHFFFKKKRIVVDRFTSWSDRRDLHQRPHYHARLP